MARVLVKRSFGKKDLPRICVITGATEGIAFMPVEFRYAELVDGRSQSHTLKLVLPFTVAAHQRWQRSRTIVAAMAFALFVLVCLPTTYFLMADPWELGPARKAVIVLGAFVLLAAFLLARALLIKLGLFAGPRLEEVRPDGRIALEIPSEEAARAFKHHERG
jgi:hypothetical protein